MNTSKTVLITGGARRIGRRLAERFAAAGYAVALHCHTSRDEATALAQTLRGQGHICEVFACDLTDIDALDGLVADVVARLGRLDVLVNNASVFERAELRDTTPELFQRQFDTNLRAPFFLTQAFARHAGKGAVVNIVDTAVTQHKHKQSAYLLSKKALAAFTQLAAKELAPDIRVNAVCPGTVLPSPGLEGEALQEHAMSLLAGRLATLDEVADAVLLLAESPAYYGQLLFIDGGTRLL